MSHAHSSGLPRGPTVNWTTSPHVWITEDKPRWSHPLQRYTVHAIVDGQEDSMGFWSKTAADRVAEQARKIPLYPKFSLRAVHASIYHD